MLLCTALIVAISIITWWVRKTYTFWDNKGVPHHNFWQYLRFCVDIYTKPLHEVVIKNYNEQGRVYGSYQGTTPILVVGDTNILREVMVSKSKNFLDRAEAQRIGSEEWRKSIFTLSGDEWKKARAIFATALTTSRMRTAVAKMQRIAERMTSRIEEALQNKSLNISDIDLDSSNYKEHQLKKCIDRILMSTAGWKVLMLFMTPCVYKILQPGFLDKSSTKEFKAFVSHLIDERKNNNKQQDDFLQLFMEASYEWENSEWKKGHMAEEKKMTLEEITAQGIVLFIAGVEGVSAALISTAYYLALHPEEQDKVFAEINKAVPQGVVTYDSLREMPHLEASIKEALRLDTPDSIIMRLCTEETTVAGVHFKPGMGEDIPFAAIHHDPENFPEPEKFKPERFLPENIDSVKPYSFLAFGAGPRNCVGMRLGMMQVKTCLACLLRRIRLETCPETMVPLRYKPRRLLPVIDGPVILRPIARRAS